ncbi:MerR family transcriptional regulator [Deinococcus cellulosilyticus]|uniref:MerR family transcriptional regulator n=1 Tax=Deinococcus cellulosilyticus (strain DSM 18568 / NBRC 106333 / KACC 11606 / 5516J-15) TaxID=1223518 RepID=A0A511N004_DEIC1|nr:MerR family transcriptional regulator [Deinococcus cellulosilyticus]GEM46162.1 MerR family transcriptional regulator [Deinococcus cellulosilyticus NBRC 106333 = KACC 11606]
MRPLVPIGRFSQVTRISVSLLRHYDEIGLLKPAHIEPSGYRYYSLSQAQDAERIRWLRSLDFSLEAIRDLLQIQDPLELQRRMQQHRDQLEKELVQLQQKIAALEEPPHLLLSRHEVFVREEEGWHAITHTETSTFLQIQQNLGALFASLYRRAADLNLRPNGAPFLMYHDQEFREEDLTVEAGIPVVAPSKDCPEVQMFPTGLVLHTLHSGPYDALSGAYTALLEGMQGLGHGPAGPPREVYLIGPSQVAAAQQYRTEVCWPIR